VINGEPLYDVEVNKMPEKELKKLAVCNACFRFWLFRNIEEIAMEANHEFKEHGGEEFSTLV
jgi:ferrochelatase